ncbi:tetratricopeptide repeat protein [Microbacterium enclense]|uniref:tetratricopeptide repeat protein n=1 Tax=Microbacterium enclense TaxID=993073 RepID=UPI00203B1534|nr:tetratricopeptide repeat protein [Microbacterium enclense]MCM3613307.1 tetratricopeptide repeat protein [Microbacterium enclense]
MIDALGVVETIGTENSFASEGLRPAAPGTGGASVGIAARHSVSEDARERARSLISGRIDSSLRFAEASAKTVRTSTTIAALAQAYQAAGEEEKAAAHATEALNLIIEQAGRGVADPMATKIALEVLLSGTDVEGALRFAERLPLSDYLKLEVATVLAHWRRFEEAHRYIADSDAEERYAVLGYVLALQGQHAAAVPHLRRALQLSPSDVESALNLSIALSHLGSRKKAISAALQARSAAPGRMDVAIHLLDTLIADGDIDRAQRELKHVAVPSSERPSRLLVAEARIKLAQGDFDRATRVLERAAIKAEGEGDYDCLAEIQSNLIQLRVARGEQDRDAGFASLLKLSRDMPSSDVAVANLARVAWRMSQAGALEERFDSVRSGIDRSRGAFIEYSIATLKGDNKQASIHALEWLRLEPENPRAATAALVALGIGEERWNEAARIALRVVRNSDDQTVLNNAAYVLSMAGMGQRAVEIIAPVATESYICKATLGLAYLASEQIELGMKLYRQAADDAEKFGDDSRSLMTGYQALVVRQLGVLYVADTSVVTALSLPPYPLPDDWEDRPEFLRLRNVAEMRGFGWPLEL